jgi:hypothetical protein
VKLDQAVEDGVAITAEQGGAASVRVMSEAAHGTSARWHTGCHCTLAGRFTVTTREPAAGPGAEAAPRRRAAAAPGRDLQRPAVPDGAT